MNLYLRTVDEFMSGSCYMGLVGDTTLPAEVDMVIRTNAAKLKAHLAIWAATFLWYIYIYMHICIYTQ